MTNPLQASKYILCLLLTGLLGSPQASEQSHASIYQAVRQHLQQRLANVSSSPRIEVKKLDARLNLPACETPLTSFDPPGRHKLGRTSVGVRCTGKRRWSLFVSASISVDLPVVVANRTLSRGSILQASDVRLQIISSDNLSTDYLDQTLQAVGKRLRRNVTSGKVINNGMLMVPKAVKFGNLVTLVSRAGGLEVRMKGKAVGQGGIGERVAVKNLSSKRVVEGTIISTDLIEVR
jgi:flagella basal body P-ring formation protein FlgA